MYPKLLKLHNFWYNQPMKEVNNIIPKQNVGPKQTVGQSDHPGLDFAAG